MQDLLGRGLTPKQRKFCLYYVESLGDGPGSIQKAYDSHSRGSARLMAHRLLHDPRIIRYINWLTDQQGLPDRTVDVLSEAMKANTEGPDGTTVPDHGTRLKAAKLIFEFTMKAAELAVKGGETISPEELEAVFSSD